jgi:hypothetical protein
MPADVEVEEILSTPLLHAEAKAIAPHLSRLAQGCGAEQVALALQPLVLVYGLGAQAKSSAFWKLYIDALADIPAESLAEALSDYAREPTAEFFPKPGPLRALALKRAAPLLKAAYRAKRAANSLPRRPPADPVKPEQFAELTAILGGKCLRPTHAVDASPDRQSSDAHRGAP